VPDRIKVIKYGTEFDPSKYATTRAGRKTTDGLGIVDHEDSPPGLVEALESCLRRSLMRCQRKLWLG